MIDQNVVNTFVGVLKTILEMELKAGNKIVETYESKDSKFPMPNATMIFLGQSFITPIQENLPNIEFRNINDPQIHIIGKRNTLTRRIFNSYAVGLNDPISKIVK
jgi:hypothetical protein